MLHRNRNKLPFKNMRLSNMNENKWRKLLSEALYKEIQHNHSTTKTIAAWARVDVRTVKYWLEERSTPSSFTLMQLMEHSEYVRQLIWKISDVPDSHMHTLFFITLKNFLKPWIVYFIQK